jgi:translocator protein
MTSSQPKQLLALAGWLLVSFTAAAIGGFASFNAGAFYRQLVRPVWAPPASLFGPVWTVLYLLMGIAAWLVWRERGKARVQGALTLFVAQLMANALWTWLFFAWRRGALAFAEIVLLLLLIAATMVVFHPIRPLAAVLLIPYALWVCFATLLTWTIWHLNPTLLATSGAVLYSVA